MTLKRVVAVCSRRTLTDEDVGLVRQGKEPKVKVTKNHGSAVVGVGDQTETALDINDALTANGDKPKRCW